LKYKAKYEFNSKFKYGIDEYFLNKTLTEYIIDNHLPLVVCVNWTMLSTVFYFIHYKNLSKKKIKLLNIFFDYIIEKLKNNKNKNKNKNKNLSLSNKFLLLDKILYNDKNEKIKLKLNKIIYKVFLYLNKNNNYKFIYPPSFYHFLLNNNNFGAYDFSEILYFNINYTNIVIYKKYFDKTFIEELNKNYLKYLN
jgi:hypothetical protein